MGDPKFIICTLKRGLIDIILTLRISLIVNEGSDPPGEADAYDKIPAIS